MKTTKMINECKCPFCNSSLLGAGWGENKFDGEFCVIHCRRCRATGPYGETEEEAWKLWKTRMYETIELNKIKKQWRKNHDQITNNFSGK